MSTANGPVEVASVSDSSFQTDMSASAESANVDKIREILFGQQMRETDVRFSRLEETVRKESAELRESLRKRLDAFESFFRRELQSHEEALKREREERIANDGQASREQKESAENFGKRLTDLDNRLTSSQRVLRQDVMDQVKNLFDEIAAKEQDWNSMLEKRMTELRRDKTDRSALASLLTEMAMRLNNQFHIPGADK